MLRELLTEWRKRLLASEGCLVVGWCKRQALGFF